MAIFRLTRPISAVAFLSACIGQAEGVGRSAAMASWGVAAVMKPIALTHAPMSGRKSRAELSRQDGLRYIQNGG
jgi:fructose-specific phosphotransferase system IIC component